MNKFTLTAAFADVNGASFVGIDTLTTVKLMGGQKNPMQGRVQKRMTGASVMVFTNQKTNGYEAMIKRRLTSEGKNPDNFVLSERAWGTRIPNMPIVEHVKGEQTFYYLEVIFLKPGSVEYLFEGRPIDKLAIVGLPAGDEGDQGGLDDKVFIRTYAAESIIAVRIDGKMYV